MASRMERYYNNRESKRRIVRNESLYQTIYDDETYSNIEGVVATPKANEIDIDKIKELIASREREKNQTRKVERRPLELEPMEESEEEEKNYDIRDILVKAKDSRENPEEEHRSLKNTEYNILKNIKINNKHDLDQEDELKELINTITSTSMLNKMSDNELSLNMFDDLKETTVMKTPAIQAVLEDKKEEELHNTSEMDNSFFTSSLGFKEKDFEQLQDLNKSIKKNNKIMKVILIILFVIIALGLGFVIYNFIIK